MKIFATSDTHGFLQGLEPKKEGADVVIIAGDISPCEFGKDAKRYVLDEFFGFVKENEGIEFIVIPGNHDFFAMDSMWMEKVFKKHKPSNLHYLIDSGCEIKGVKFWGTPWVKRINGGWAFESRYDSDDKNLWEAFSKIPYGLDVLIAHSPPRFKGAVVDFSEIGEGNYYRGPFGSKCLAEEIVRKMPVLVFCGHIHTGSHLPCTIGIHGNVISRDSEGISWDKPMTSVFNVSRLDERYDIAYGPTVVNYFRNIKGWDVVKAGQTVKGNQYHDHRNHI